MSGAVAAKSVRWVASAATKLRRNWGWRCNCTYFAPKGAITATAITTAVASATTYGRRAPVRRASEQAAGDDHEHDRGQRAEVARGQRHRAQREPQRNAAAAGRVLEETKEQEEHEGDEGTAHDELKMFVVHEAARRERVGERGDERRTPVAHDPHRQPVHAPRRQHPRAQIDHVQGQHVAEERAQHPVHERDGQQRVAVREHVVRGKEDGRVPEGTPAVRQPDLHPADDPEVQQGIAGVAGDVRTEPGDVRERQPDRDREEQPEQDQRVRSAGPNCGLRVVVDRRPLRHGRRPVEHRPTLYAAGARTVALRVGAEGFEPPTPCASCRCSAN